MKTNPFFTQPAFMLGDNTVGRNNNRRKVNEMPVELVDKVVSVTKETSELGEGIAKFLYSVRVSAADGWNASEDIPELIRAALTDLLPALTGVENIGDEVKESPEEFAAALALIGVDIYKAFTRELPVVKEWE